MQKQGRIVIGDPDLEDRLGRRGKLRPEPERIEDLARAVSNRRGAPVEGLAEHRRRILAVDDNDREPGAGAGGTEQEPDHAAAGDQQLGIVDHAAPAAAVSCRRGAAAGTAERGRAGS